MLGVVYTSTLRDFLRPGRMVVWAMVSLVIGLLCRVWMRMGSGTTAKAANLLGRRWFGSEISKEYVRIAKERLRQYLRGDEKAAGA